MAKPVIFILSTTIFILFYNHEVSTFVEKKTCERLRSDSICSQMQSKYNYTVFPNKFSTNGRYHVSQESALQQLREFQPLISLGCSKYLRMFLCSYYLPMCSVSGADEPFEVTACRSLCESVKTCCEPAFKNIGLQWPEILSCSKFPELKPDTGVVCIQPSEITGSCSGSINPIKYSNEMINKISEIINKFNNMPQPTDTTSSSTTSTSEFPLIPSSYLPVKNNKSCFPPQRYVQIPDEDKTNETCRQICGADVLFRKEDKKFAEIWTAVWACLCFVSTAVTVFTIVIDLERFKYPERPIVFLSLCYMFYSIAYIMRIFLGASKVSCEESKMFTSYVIQKDLDNTWCVITFLILYYFGMAASIWWVILTVAWFLAAARKWSCEAIQSQCSLFHLAAWAIPAIKTIIILVMRKVDGDELTGICFLSPRDSGVHMGFVLVPLFVYLIIGTVLILSGFISLFKIRRNLDSYAVRNDANNIQKLERLMVKIGCFSVLYTIPAACVIGCHYYEHVNHKLWEARSRVAPCYDGKEEYHPSSYIIEHHPTISPYNNNENVINDNIATPSKQQPRALACYLRESIPATEVFMLKLFMSLVIGVTTGMWIWTQKTAKTWGTFCTSHLGLKKSSANIPKYNPSSRPQPAATSTALPLTTTQQPQGHYHHHQGQPLYGGSHNLSSSQITTGRSQLHNNPFYYGHRNPGGGSLGETAVFHNKRSADGTGIGGNYSNITPPPNNNMYASPQPDTAMLSKPLLTAINLRQHNENESIKRQQRQHQENLMVNTTNNTFINNTTPSPRLDIAGGVVSTGGAIQSNAAFASMNNL